VPKNYSDVANDGSLPDAAPRLTLAIVALENFVTMTDPNPIVMISGGPGQASSQMLHSNAIALHLRRTRGIALIDQRGTGASSPSLGCDAASPQELDENRLNDPEIEPDTPVADRLSDCIGKWRSRGVDFNVFDSRSAALDLRSVRLGLGLRQWNLIGTSYGARVALDAMRVDPDGIRSVVLNSPQALTPHFDRDFAENRARLFTQLFVDCADDIYCREEFGDLETHLEKIRAHLRDEGMDIYLRQSSGELVRVSVGWEDVVNGLYTHMNFSFGAEPVARYIHELSRMVQGRLSLNDDEVARIFQNSLGNQDFGMAIAMHIAVRCREDVHGYDEAVARAAAARALGLYAEDTILQTYQASCNAMESVPVDPAFHEPVISAIPALILTGDMDPLTPTAWAERITQTLSKGQLLTFRGMAHDIYGTSICAQAITANFIDAPDRAVDVSCVGSHRPVFAPVQR
jgi:pimeloyl-ACP methyl ester carboxylesterase